VALVPYAARRADNNDKENLIDSVDCFIFDCDGEWLSCTSAAAAAAVASMHAGSCRHACSALDT
jgi:hypothetical protein